MKASTRDSFEVALELVKKLTPEEKLQLSKVLERDLLDARLSALLKVFRTEEITLDDIAVETEAVRKEIYLREKGTEGHR
ncbi:MAG: hypothetical protein MUC38_03385 [Cyclobacteriaceae bacterium]|nr:hypothetical protein [Cyclobacteriaceae bacterium]